MRFISFALALSLCVPIVAQAPKTAKSVKLSRPGVTRPQGTFTTGEVVKGGVVKGKFKILLSNKKQLPVDATGVKFTNREGVNVDPKSVKAGTRVAVVGKLVGSTFRAKSVTVVLPPGQKSFAKVAPKGIVAR